MVMNHTFYHKEMYATKTKSVQPLLLISSHLEHEKKITGLSVVESWIIEDEEKDKSKLYGFDLPKGTWMISMKVNNDEVWNDVKEGKVKGFSIEGYFADKFEMSAEEDEATEVLNELKKLLNIK